MAVVAGTMAAGLLVAAPLVGPAGARTVLVVQTGHVASLGTLLVTPKQLVLYEYSADTKNKSNCTGACAKAWPPYLLAAGVTSVHGPHTLHGLGTIHRGHRLQVTIGGHPLYTFSGDHGADQANGQGFGGTWYVVGPTGHIVQTKVAAPAAVVPPPVTSPPVTSPPVTAPPVTAPPATTPPATSPPVTSPPATTAPGGGYGY